MGCDIHWTLEVKRGSKWLGPIPTVNSKSLSARHKKEQVMTAAEYKEALATRDALAQLLQEVIAAGFDTARDYNWPKAIEDARTVLAGPTPVITIE